MRIFDVRAPNIGTYAQMLALVAPVTGATFTVTNWGRSLWYYNGTIWRPFGGRVVLRNLAANVNGSTAAAEQILDQLPIPANLLIANGDSLRTILGVNKSGTSETMSQSIKIGTTGTTSDTGIGSGSQPTGPNRSGGAVNDFRRESATSMLRLGASTGNLAYSGSVASVTSPITISNLNLDQYLSFAVTKSGSGEVPTLQTWQVEFVAAA